MSFDRRRQPSPATAMRPLCVLLVVSLARAKETFYATKCCGAFEMLSGDGKLCVDAPWPRNHTLNLEQRTDLMAIQLQAGDLPWVRRWMPPGLSLDRKVDAYLSYLPRLQEKSLVRSVDEAVEWDQRQAENEGAAYWRRRVVFTKSSSVVRRISFRAVTAHLKLFAWCVDAARPPLAPFAVVVERDCDVDECASKCCDKGKVAEAKGEGWRCRDDARGNWSPAASSFARFLSDLPLERKRALKCGSAPKRGLRLSPGDVGAARLLRRRYHNFLFSSWGACVDFEHRGNESLGEILIYCQVSRITRGVYWLLRPLCFLSILLLVVALLAVVCDSAMRRKAHGWCIACHGVCLLAFNLGQMAYYLTISDEIDDWGFVAFHLKKICTQFALSMYFLAMAANCWLTALCFNLTLGFGKLQMARPGGGKERKKFLVLSAFAWGLPALMAGLCAHAFESDPKSRKWYSPSLMETRTCYNELGYTHLEGFYWLADPSIKSGTALFYYGPMCCLVIVNALCIARTLRKVQFLRRGNSVLHKEEDSVSGGHRQTEGGNPRADNARNKEGVRSTAADAKTIRLYVKMLLMTGLVEMFAETLAWTTKLYSEREHFSFEDHALSYRATGSVADCFRAACVVWLAAPEGGYSGAVRRRLKSGGRGRGRGRGGAGGRW